MPQGTVLGKGAANGPAVSNRLECLLRVLVKGREICVFKSNDHVVAGG